MINLLRRLFGRERSAQPIMVKAAEPAVEQELVFTVVPGPDSVSTMDTLEHRLRAALGTPPIGVVDGHEMALSGSDALIYLYGPDAKAMYDAVRSVIVETDWIKEASVFVCLGDPNDRDAEEVRFTLGGSFEWPTD